MIIYSPQIITAFETVILTFYLFAVCWFFNVCLKCILAFAVIVYFNKRNQLLCNFIIWTFEIKAVLLSASLKIFKICLLFSVRACLISLITMTATCKLICIFYCFLCSLPFCFLLSIHPSIRWWVREEWWKSRKTIHHVPWTAQNLG